MSEHEPFALESQTVEEAIAAAERLADQSRDVRWPEHLAEMLDVLSATLLRRGMPEDAAEETARVLAIAQAKHIGGRPFYFPAGAVLERALVHDRIFREHRRGNTDALARQHGMTPRSIERIARQQLLLRRRRLQPELPLKESPDGT